MIKTLDDKPLVIANLSFMHDDFQTLNHSEVIPIRRLPEPFLKCSSDGTFDTRDGSWSKYWTD